MIQGIELQMISRLLTSEDQAEIDALCEYDESYYSVYGKQIKFILDHRSKYGTIPDVFTFQAEFVDDNITLVDVNETTKYLEEQIRKNKQYIIFLATFNKLQELMSGDVSEAWEYIERQCESAMSLDNVQPMNIIKQAEERAKIVQDASKETRIPTGFAEIDKLMYGGFSTIEDFILVVARTNTGKSWLMTKMMESAQKAGYNVAYYSPEMRAEYIGTRFDSWRAHFKNSDLYQGKYTDDYSHYLKNLENETADAFIIEDKDMPGGVTVQKLSMFVKRHGIKLLIIDGLSYMTDSQKSTRDYEKYKHISEELFVLSKTYKCAVVVTMQANRDTKDMVDEKGVPFPNLYSIEGSDVPARVATQVFTVRQIFDQHVLDIRLEKSRNAKNEKPVLSYSWDVNTGNVQYIPGDVQINNTTVSPVQDNILTNVQGPTDDLASLELEDQDVEF